MNNKIPYIIISVVLIIASIALFYFLVISQFEKISSQEKEITDLKYTLDNTTNYFNEVKQNAESLEALGWDNVLKKIDANFMSGPFFIHNMDAYLNGIVVKSGLYIKSISIEGVSESFEVGKTEQKKDEEKPKEISVSFDLCGSYSSFRELLNIFEKQVLVINIDSIGISIGSGGGNEEETVSTDTNLNFQIKGNIPSK